MKVRLRRVGLVAAMGLVSLNIWTGAPLFAVWVGSRMQHDSHQPTMGAVAVGVLELAAGLFPAGAGVVLVLATVCSTLVHVLALRSARYDVVVGRPQQRREQSPWLRSLRGERA